MTLGVVFQDGDGHITQANPAAESILGLSLDQMQGRTSMDSRWKAIHEDGSDYPGNTHPAMIALATGEEVQGALMGVLHPSKEDYIWITIDAIPLTRPGESKPYQVYATFQDITGRKKAETALVASEQQMQSVFSTMTEGIILIDPNGQIVQANPAAERILGLTKLEIEDRTYVAAAWDILRPDMTAMPPEEMPGPRAMAEKKPINDVIMGVRQPTGALSWLNVCATPIIDRSNKLKGIVGTFADISQRKKAEAEQKLLMADLKAKNLELERFTYTVSHDLRSPVITIKGFLGMLEKDAQAGKGQQISQDISHIKTATDRMERLLVDLLDYSRLGQSMGPAKQCNMNAIAAETIKLLTGAITELDANLKIDDKLPDVLGDKLLLGQLLQNLVENALKYMGNQNNPQIQIGFDGRKKGGCYFVRDNGMGIDPDQFEKIFHIFSQLNPNSGGTGVGLSLVKRIVELHDGECWVESKIDTGSTFYFTLPLV